MAETVVGRWSKDIGEMEKDIGRMENEATQRWKNNLSELRQVFDTFETKFKAEIGSLEGVTKALRDAFERFAKDFNSDIESLFSHIWGTQEDREAWQRKYGR